MVDIRFSNRVDSSRKPLDIRVKMIRETNAFLSWSLRKDRGLPRIACRQVDQGGLGWVLKHVGAKALAMRWWGRVLSDRRLNK